MGKGGSKARQPAAAPAATGLLPWPRFASPTPGCSPPGLQQALPLLASCDMASPEGLNRQPFQQQQEKGQELQGLLLPAMGAGAKGGRQRRAEGKEVAGQEGQGQGQGQVEAVSRQAQSLLQPLVGRVGPLRPQRLSSSTLDQG
ncbi:hypothetical protein HaLaN_02882 [Haematococcus lacustris]|uniref:Uncharacterized protein n=1 Tax=Haematococcus lacustris TaxID=44745 RepID=A0A699YJB1_HAELA|nr:hypothetical protein HaLaN_02882 [Haematococcus lacustris]